MRHHNEPLHHERDRLTIFPPNYRFLGKARSMTQHNNDNDDDQRQRANLIALAIVVLLVAGTVWLVMKYKQSSELEDCFLSGRKNCAPIEVPSQ